jgi:hypothetical protein
MIVASKFFVYSRAIGSYVRCINSSLLLYKYCNNTILKQIHKLVELKLNPQPTWSDPSEIDSLDLDSDLYHGFFTSGQVASDSTFEQFVLGYVHLVITKSNFYTIFFLIENHIN